MKYWVSNAQSPVGKALINALSAAGVEWISPELPAIASEKEIIHAVHEYGVPDVLVMTPRTIVPLSVEHSSEQEVSDAFFSNIQNVFLLTRYLGGAMAAKGQGRILYVGSVHAEKPTGKSFAYSAAMGAMNMLCMEAALQLGRSGVVCTYLEVGPIEGDADILDNEKTPLYDNSDARMAHGKNPSPEKIAEYIQYIANEPGVLLNGSSIRMDDAFTRNYRPRIGGDPDWTYSLPEDEH